MSVTILEALENAEINFKNASKSPICAMLATEQLHNAIAFLERGHSPYAIIDELLEKYPNPDEAPYVEK